MKSRQFRRKAPTLSFAEADDDEDAEGATLAPAVIAASRKAKPKEVHKDKKGTAGRLSFDDTEDAPANAHSYDRRTAVQLDAAKFNQLRVGSGSAKPSNTQIATAGTEKIACACECCLCRGSWAFTTVLATCTVI